MFVRDVGYVCWPAATDGRFEAYDDLLAAERRALAPLEAEGFALLDHGLSRVVLATPGDGGDTVVKLARCGMGGGFGDGRTANLLEASLTATEGDDAPILPGLHCGQRGCWAVYPRVETGGLPDGRGGSGGPMADVEGTVASVRRWLEDHAPWLDAAEAVAPENRCVWRGRLRTLDYSHPGDNPGPLGVPAHVDAERVVERVDALRAAGEKRDLRDGGGFVDDGGGRA